MMLPFHVIALSSFFVVTKAQSVPTTVLNGPQIASKWAISDPLAVYDSGSNTFTMTYSGTSGGIDSSNFHVSFWDKHCKDPEQIDGKELDKGIYNNEIIANYEITEGKQTYVFPTAYSFGQGFVHGLCVLGAKSATASSSDLGFTYTPLTGFASGIKLWDNFNADSVGVKDGGAELCEGGLYLRPSGVHGPATGTDITVEATPVDSSAGVTVCAFVEKPFTHTDNVKHDRSSNWHILLPKQGFMESSKTFGWNYSPSDSNKWTSYCKPLLPKATLSFKLDTNVLAKDDNIYTSPSSDTDEGKMEICTRMSVGYADANAGFTEVNFVESLLTIKYDLQDDVNLSDFNVAPKIKDTSNESKEYAVEASLCSGSVAPFDQGSLICVDVKPNDDSAKDGIVMKSIDSFEWKRGETTQPAITDSNVESDNKLTSITCDANFDSCSINSVLFADFYESAGVVSGSGSATMMFKTDRRALMGGSASASGRSLQNAAAVAAATSEFDIAIPVGVSDEDGVGALKTAGGASLLFGSTSALASIIVIVVGLVSVSADLMA